MKRIIKNFDQLATTSLRKQTLLIAEAGLEAILTPKIVRKLISVDGDAVLHVRDQKFSLKKYNRVVVVGFGKAALEAVATLQTILGDRISSGYVIDIADKPLKNIISKTGTHPLPSLVNVLATHELMGMLGACTEEDLIICVVSGGGSSLLCAPAEVTIEEERAITQALMNSGATIKEENTVRKHLSLVKGGQLAKIAYPATMVNLIFSDVPGDDLGEVASGPTFLDKSTVHDAMNILNKYEILKACKMHSCGLVETPKENKYFTKVHNIPLCSGKDALEAMAAKASDLGFRPKVWNDKFAGEASELGPEIAKAAQSGVCLLAAGESTVTITPDRKGKGGRNQELALAALLHLPENSVLAAIASDGRDNSDLAGAVVSAETQQAIKAAGLDINRSLEYHDEYDLLVEANAALDTGITGTNVSDLIICLQQ